MILPPAERWISTTQLLDKTNPVSNLWPHSEATLRLWISKGKLKAWRHGRKVFVDINDLKAAFVPYVPKK